MNDDIFPLAHIPRELLAKRPDGPGIPVLCPYWNTLVRIEEKWIGDSPFSCPCCGYLVYAKKDFVGTVTLVEAV